MGEETPLIRATVCYIRKDKKTLMMHRNKRPDDFHYGKWIPPGGKIKQGEKPEEGIKREVLEETGLKLKKVVKRGEVLFDTEGRTFSNGQTQSHWHVTMYECSDFEGEQFTECHEGTLAWVEDEKLSDLPMWEADYLVLEWLKQPKFFSAVARYEGEKLSKHEVRYD